MFVVGVPDDIAGQVPVAIVKVSSTVSKIKVMEKARLLGPQYTLEAVYTFEDLELESIPTTSIGKPRRTMLADIVVKKRLAGRSEISEIESQHGEVAILEERLGDIWEQLMGVRPSKTDDIFCLADSITLLRYCDAVLRVYGKRLYLQDLSRCNTIETQAKLLITRDSSPRIEVGMEQQVIVQNDDYRALSKREQGYSFSQHLVSKVEPVDTLAAARDQIERFDLDRSDVEDIIPIRNSMYRAVVGQRPQSYRTRVVFRVHNATISHIYDGLFKWLANRPLLRTILLGAQGLLYQIVVRHSHNLFQKLVHEVTAETEKEAKDLYEHSSADNHSPMFMFNATIIRVKETGRYLLCLTYNHSIVDALTLLSWHRDIDRLIHNCNTVIPTQTPYRLFADLFAEYQESQPAQQAISFHVQRLRGISRYKNAIWPKQRAPGMMIASDQDSFYFSERQNSRDCIWKGEWQARAEEFRFPRRSRIVCLPGLSKLRSSFNLEPMLFTKCALALFNVIQTKSSVALFNSWESARSWPFMPNWIANALQPAMSIDGPTVEWILNMFEVNGEETLVDFIQRMVLEQERIICHEHVPWEKVVQELREEGEVATNASFRQSFVWDVSMGVAASRGFRSDFDTLEPVAKYDWPDW